MKSYHQWEEPSEEQNLVGIQRGWGRHGDWKGDLRGSTSMLWGWWSGLPLWYLQLCFLWTVDFCSNFLVLLSPPFHLDNRNRQLPECTVRSLLRGICDSPALWVCLDFIYPHCVGKSAMAWTEIKWQEAAELKDVFLHLICTQGYTEAAEDQRKDRLPWQTGLDFNSDSFSPFSKVFELQFPGLWHGRSMDLYSIGLSKCWNNIVRCSK